MKLNKRWSRKKILDSDGFEVFPGCTISFSYGIPPVVVIAPVVERDGKLVALCDGHNPSECDVSELEGHVGNFFVRGPVKTRARHDVGKR